MMRFVTLYVLVSFVFINVAWAAPPVIDSATLGSDNTGVPFAYQYAREGTTLTLTFNSDQVLVAGSSVTIGGETINLGAGLSCTGSGPYNCTASLTVTGSAPIADGSITHSIHAVSLEGATDEPSVGTTNSGITLDRVAPNPPTIMTPTNGSTVRMATYFRDGGCDDSNDYLTISNSNSLIEGLYQMENGYPLVTGCGYTDDHIFWKAAADGTNQVISVTETDYAGNQSTPVNISVTVDTPTPTPGWSADSGIDNAQLGRSTAIGDVNGDGFPDVIAGASGYTNGENSEGQLNVYYGSATGPSDTPDWQYESDIANGELGTYTVSGDVNGDGYADILSSVPSYSNGESSEGAIFIFHGSASGPSSTPDAIIESNIVFESYGSYPIATPGDVNNDGYDDLLLADGNYYDGVGYVGQVLLYYGSASGISTTPDQTWEGTGVERIGNAAAGDGDVNGDGYDDVLMNTEGGSLWVYYGSASGPSATPDWTYTDQPGYYSIGYQSGYAGDVNGDGYDEIVTTLGAAAGAFYGSASGPSSTFDWTFSDEEGIESNDGTFAYGDINNDGYGDLIIHNPNFGHTSYTGGYGIVYAFYGSPNGLRGVPDWTDEPETFFSSNFGVDAAVGDVNQDGLDDILVGASDFGSFESYFSSGEGRILLYYGNTDTVQPLPKQVITDDYLSYPTPSVSGDFDGDGHRDFAVGSYNYGPGGSLSGYYGDGNGNFPSTPDWVYTGTSSAYLAASGALSAGDFNDDGYDDVVASDQNYDADLSFPREGEVIVFYGSALGLSATPDWTYVGAPGDQIGFAVANAGDVNGDNVDDIIASGVYGSTTVFYGSAFGLSATPDWTFASPDPYAFGDMAASGGDVNGDGYDDILVTDPYYSNGENEEGAVYLFYGSATGPSAVPDWTGESNFVDACLGGKYCNQGWGGPLGQSGDYNNDGYSDIAVGAMNYSDPALVDFNSYGRDGAVYVWYGSATGPAATEDLRLIGEPMSAFGTGVMSPGDVNGDGYADLAVVASDIDSWENYPDTAGGQGYEGRFYIYHGSGSGLITTPASVGESNKTLNWWMSAAPLGDANEDGYDDFLMNAVLYVDEARLSDPDPGAIFVYLSQGGFTVTESGGSTEMTEGGVGDTFTVVLNSEPTSDVVFDIVSQDLGAATVSLSTLTFTSANWDTPRTITVNPVSDLDANDERVPIVVSINRAASNDAFDDLYAQQVLALVYDDDAPSSTTQPTVTNSAASSISSTTATLNGNITATGGENPSVRGFHYGLSGAYGSTTSEIGSFGVGVFALPVTGLTCATTYHFEAYATNSAGIGDSANLTFITSACPSGPTSTPTSTPSSSGGSSSGSKAATGAATTSPVIVPPTTPPPYVLPPIPSNTVKPTSPWQPAPGGSTGASTGNVDRSELIIPPHIEQAPTNPPRAVVEEEIVRETAPPEEGMLKRVLGISTEAIREAFNVVRGNRWGQMLTALGLVSLILRPLVTSLRVQSLGDAWLVVRRLFSMLAPRKRRIVEPWGTVYDGRTKRPLDPAYVSLVSVDSGEEVLGAVTDIEGRYGFLPPPGRYRVVPSKTHYSFPSDDLFKKHNDLVYDNLYFGETFDVVDHTTVVRRNIPMDAEGRDWNEEEKVRMGFTNKRKRRQIWIKILNTLFLAGAAYTLYVLFVSPNLWNWVMGIAYVIIWTAEMLWKRHFHLTAVVRNSNGDPVPFAVIKVFHPDQDIVVKKVVADESGKFYFLVAPGRYTVVVEIKDGEGNYQPVLTLRNQNLSRGILLKDMGRGVGEAFKPPPARGPPPASRYYYAIKGYKSYAPARYTYRE